MERRTYLTAVGTAATGLAVGVAGCGGDPGAGAGTDVTETGGLVGTTAEETADVGGEQETEGIDTSGTTIDMVAEDSEYYFDPIGLYVEPGATVTWANASGSHSSTAYLESHDAADSTRIPADGNAWDSDTISDEGETFEHTVETVGTYDYFCTEHRSEGMVGRLVVGEAGGPGADGNPPDGELPPSEEIVDQRTIRYEDFTD